jgi:hypothetical protein
MHGAQARKLAKKAAKATKSVAKKAVKAAQKIVAKAKKGVNAAQKKLAKAKQSGSKAAIKKAKAALKKAQKQLKKGQKTVRLGCNARASATPWDAGQRRGLPASPAVCGYLREAFLPYATCDGVGGMRVERLRRCEGWRAGGEPIGRPMRGWGSADARLGSADARLAERMEARQRGRMRVRCMGSEGWRSTHAWCAGSQAC